MADNKEDEEVVIEELAPGDFQGEGEQVSALRASQEKAGEYSYYYAARKGASEGLPQDAVIREVDPMMRADGLGPKKLEVEAQAKLEGKVDLDKVRWISTFSFSDDGAVVKVYVEFPEVIKGADITCEWEKYGVQLLVTLPGSGLTYGVRVRDAEGWILEHERNGGFAHEIDPEKCKYRVASNGQRVTLTVAKKDDKEKWSELRKEGLQKKFK